METHVSLVRTEIEFGMTFAGIAESAYSEGQLRRGDSALGVALHAYEQASKLMSDFTESAEELLLRLRELEAALRSLEAKP
jgi:hypothetical protein